jgi:hypothetical protein
MLGLSEDPVSATLQNETCAMDAYGAGFHDDCAFSRPASDPRFTVLLSYVMQQKPAITLLNYDGAASPPP